MFVNFLLALSLFSFFVCVFLFWKKIPLLLSLPSLKKESTIKRWIKAFFKRFFTFSIWRIEYWVLKFEKFISRIRILILKIDNFTFSLLRKLKERRKIEKKEDESFWDKITKE